MYSLETKNKINGQSLNCQYMLVQTLKEKGIY